MKTGRLSLNTWPIRDLRSTVRSSSWVGLDPHPKWTKIVVDSVSSLAPVSQFLTPSLASLRTLEARRRLRGRDAPSHPRVHATPRAPPDARASSVRGVASDRPENRTRFFEAVTWHRECPFALFRGRRGPRLGFQGRLARGRTRRSRARDGRREAGARRASIETSADRPPLPANPRRAKKRNDDERVKRDA